LQMNNYIISTSSQMCGSAIMREVDEDEASALLWLHQSAVMREVSYFSGRISLL
jgi:hypothetical protein